MIKKRNVQMSFVREFEDDGSSGKDIKLDGLRKHFGGNLSGAMNAVIDFFYDRKIAESYTFDELA